MLTKMRMAIFATFVRKKHETFCKFRVKMSLFCCFFALLQHFRLTTNLFQLHTTWISTKILSSEEMFYFLKCLPESVVLKSAGVLPVSQFFQNLRSSDVNIKHKTACPNLNSKKYKGRQRQLIFRVEVLGLFIGRKAFLILASISVSLNRDYLQHTCANFFSRYSSAFFLERIFVGNLQRSKEYRYYLSFD